MRRLIAHRLRRHLFTGLLLVAVAFRALIPTGFMPSSDRPFALEICHGGMHAHAGHGKDGTAGHVPAPDQPRYEHCPFGAAPAPGPLASLSVSIPAAPVAPRSIGRIAPLRVGARLQRAQNARAPPLSV